jgi:ubiquinone/menaquinone biosynthesis C-methylase UbiE
LKLRYDDASFDAVFAFFVLHHLSGHKLGKVQAAMMQGLAEIDRVIKPGGSFIYSEMFQRKTIRDYFTCKGYEIAHRQNFLAVIELVIIRKQASAAPGTAGLSTASTLPATTG